MKEETRSFYEAAVQRAVDHVATRLDDALQLEVLAREAALAPLHFHRIFRGLVGETPLELHRRLRLERAALRLLRTDEAVTRIAFEAGYETHEAFTRAFRQAYGDSPSGFRKPVEACGPERTRTEIAARCGVHFREGGAPVTLRFTRGGTPMNIEIKQLSEQRVFTVRHVGPYDRIGEAFGRLGALAGPAGLFGLSTQMIAIYHDDPEGKPKEELCSDAAITVPEGAPLPAGLAEQRIAAGRYACATHVGPYSGLGDAWARLMGGWLPESGHRLAEGVSFEIYRNDPSTTPPEALRTELYVPLA